MISTKIISTRLISAARTIGQVQKASLRKSLLYLACATTLTALPVTKALSESLEAIHITGENAGELVLTENKLSLAPWQSTALSGKARTVMHMAGRKSARKMQDAFIEALKAAKFDAQYYQTTSIVDLSDAIWGTGSFVESKLEQNKRSFPWSSVVLDRDGAFRAAHKLTPSSSAVYVLDGNGEILFSKEGQLSQTEIDTIIALLNTEISKIKAQKPQSS